MLIPEGLTRDQLEMIAEVLTQSWRYQMIGDGLDPRTANRIIVQTIAAGMRQAANMELARTAGENVVPFRAGSAA